jgi:hypothetical protein
MRMLDVSSNKLFIGHEGWIRLFAAKYGAAVYNDTAELSTLFYNNNLTETAKFLVHSETACEEGAGCVYCSNEDMLAGGSYNNYLRSEGVYSDGNWTYPGDLHFRAYDGVDGNEDTVLNPLSFDEVDTDDNGILSREESEQFAVNYLTGHNMGLLLGLNAKTFENGYSDGSGISFLHNNIYIGDLNSDGAIQYQEVTDWQGTRQEIVYRQYLWQNTTYLGYLYVPDRDVYFPNDGSNGTNIAFWGAALARNLRMSAHDANFDFMFIKPLDYYRGQKPLSYPPEFKIKETDEDNPTDTNNIFSFEMQGYY